MAAIVVPYDQSWPTRFAEEAARIEAALGVLLTGPVEHIGSTAIPGMEAKPIIDMLAPVATLDDAWRAVGPLSALGYVESPHRADAVRVGRDGTHHLHLTRTDSELWRERLLFRDAMRADDALRAEYAALKHRLLEEADGRVYDSAHKRDFVRRVLRSAGHDLRDGLHTDGRS